MEQELSEKFNNIDQRLDTLMAFLHKNMVTKDEFKELSDRVDRLEQTVSRLVDTVEKLAVGVNKISDEHTVLKHQVVVMQDWIREASKKLGIEFKL